MPTKKSKGWVKMYRSIQAGELWKDKPYAEGQAWVDLILAACFQDNGNLKAGELIVSQRDLCVKWGWGRQRIRGFLARLEHDGSITLFPTQMATKITICKYSSYQAGKPSGQPLSNPPATHQQPTLYNKNDKNDKECIIIGNISFKLSFVEDKKKLFPMLDVIGEIRKCLNYWSSKGRSIKDWNKAVSNWLSIAYDRSGVTGRGETGSGYERFVKYRHRTEQ